MLRLSVVLLLPVVGSFMPCHNQGGIVAEALPISTRELIVVPPP